MTKYSRYGSELPAACSVAKGSSEPSRAGQSVIEVIVAVSLMVIIAGSSVIAVLGSFKTS